MSYVSDIEQIDIITLDDIISASRNNVSNENKARPWYCNGLDHGTAVLSTEEQLCCYIAAYGEMHKQKLEKAFEAFPFKNLDSSFEIIDWGCGQGLASVYLISQLRSKNLIGKLKKVTLIEPSESALRRADFNVNKTLGENVEVESIQKFLPAYLANPNSIDSLHIEEPICIHLFSNILDIPEIDLKKLANIIASSGYQHYFICVGPVNYGNQRIEAFSRYFSFDSSNLFANVFLPQYRHLNNGKWFGCVAKGFKVIRSEGKPFLIPLSFYPPKEFIAAYQLDAIRTREKDISGLLAFNVLAPFDIGASIYTDVDPILAVINNIITRGTPTKTSPFIEEQFARILAATTIQERYGAIDYVSSDYQLIEKYKDYLRFIPIGIARIEKVVVEAAMTDRLSLDKEQLDVVVKEDMIPCSALAFADLSLMFDHLCALSRDYDKRRFPKINLHIISPTNSNSPFHLGNPTYSSTKKLNREKEYDLVIDINFAEKSDAENVQFSEFKVKNDCYFNIRSCVMTTSRQIYTSDRIVYKPLTRLNQSGGYDNIEKNVEHLNYFLNLIFRKKSFRPGQLPILTRALQNKGVIGLLPTGGGKSLTYQLAAMLQPGITVVIDPLKSLMEDQYDGLIAAGIDACTFINSELGPEIRAQHEDMMESSQVLIAFMSPERLCIYPFRERLNNMHELGVYFSYGVIDEVHCVSEWGQDFRPSYLHLGRNLYQYVRAKEGRISLFGLTATASFDVLSDVERELSGYGAFTLDPETIVRYENSNRLELQYKVERVEVEYEPDRFDDHGLLYNYPTPVKLGDKWSAYKQKSSFLKNLLGKIPHYLDELLEEDSLNEIVSRFKDREELSSIDPSKLIVNVESDYLSMRPDYKFSGIVFCPHVNSTGISVSVNSKELSNLCEVGSFSGSDQTGETDNKSMENMRKFRENKLPLMVATKAFGMGIDKPNVRFTVNMNYSSSLESFIQEAGRAGRDGHMALSLILLADYNLWRINPSCNQRDSKGIISLIRGKWYKKSDLELIIRDFGLNISQSEIDICNPMTDFVRLKCNTDNCQKDRDGNPIEDRFGNKKKLYWKCTEGCSKYSDCKLRHVDPKLRWEWIYYPDLLRYLRENRIRLTSSDYEYNGPDYSNVMFFFDQNFKGEFEEKKKMHELLSIKEVSYFVGNDSQYKKDREKIGKGFMEALLNARLGEELVVFISYDDDSFQDISKAIYRMCVIGLVDDFTQDYSRHSFRIVTTRKKTGSYYQRLKDFLMRYYSEDRAENEVERASVRKGNNEIHKCLGYLTEFVYDKVVMKRKRAIDDMRSFCLTGIDNAKDWKEINEDLKDEIFFYFNSKFARAGYRTENDEPFSLYDDVVEDKKRDFATLFKYMRVIDNDVIGASGSPKDNIKHLRGAVRLIRRSETDVNPVLSLLNVFCLLILKRPEDMGLSKEIEDSFIEGYLAFEEQTSDKETFYTNIQRFYEELNTKNRNVVSGTDKVSLKNLQISSEVLINDQWLNIFRQNYTI